MKILFETPCPPVEPWRRAAQALGHELGSYEPEKALEAFARHKPDIVIVPGEIGRALAKALARFPARLIPVRWDSGRGWTRPAADVTKDFPGGKHRPEFAVDVAFVGDFKPEHALYLDQLLDLRTIVFGNGPRPECVGRVPGSDVADVYKSAKVSLDLNGLPAVVMAIQAAGGRCVSSRKYQNTGIKPLDLCFGSDDPLTFRELVHHEPKYVAGADVLMSHTYQDRLVELLEWAARPVGGDLSL